jgi:hypothetical protein
MKNIKYLKKFFIIKKMNNLYIQKINNLYHKVYLEI